MHYILLNNCSSSLRQQPWVASCSLGIQSKQVILNPIKASDTPILGRRKRSESSVVGVATASTLHKQI